MTTTKGVHTRLTERDEQQSKKCIAEYLIYMKAEKYVVVRELGSENNNPHYHIYTESSNDKQSLDKARKWLAYRGWSGATRIVQTWGSQESDMRYFYKGTSVGIESVDIVSTTIDPFIGVQLNKQYWEINKKYVANAKEKAANATTRLYVQCKGIFAERKVKYPTLREVIEVFVKDRLHMLQPLDPMKHAGAINCVYTRLHLDSAPTDEEEKCDAYESMILGYELACGKRHVG